MKARILEIFYTDLKIMPFSMGVLNSELELTSKIAVISMVD